MKLKWPINFIIVVCVCLVSFLVLLNNDSARAAQNGSEKIEGSLLDQIYADGTADFILRFNDQADLTAAFSMDWDARGEYVYNALRETAERSQAQAKAILEARGMTYQTFIAGNDLYVFGGSQQAGKNNTTSQEISTVNQLAALPEVISVRLTRTYSIDPNWVSQSFETVNWAGDLLAEQLLTTVTNTVTASMDWGITDTKANQFWSTLGVKGSGMVVANIDTGVQWNHPALDQAYKCNTDPGDLACWYEPIKPDGTPYCPGIPCDNIGHGTHTMGTMVGDDDPSLAYIVGMAPDAKWIACKGCEDSTCSDFALNACADWVLAPNGNPANRPNVVNNSWGDVGGNSWYLTKVQAWVAAGIFPAFSAGNFGNACGTLGSPGDYQASFSSAAHDDSRNIAYFSSRGPSAVFGDTPYTKPNISAPGVSICSSVPTNSWNCWASGTSMASPHTAGAVALLWSCNPGLVGNVDATFRLLQNTADATPAGNCSAPPDGEGNYTFGYGYLDVLAAGITNCNLNLSATSLYTTLAPDGTKTVPITLINQTNHPADWQIIEISHPLEAGSQTYTALPTDVPRNGTSTSDSSSPSEAAADVPWLSESPTSGSLAAGASVIVNITFNSTGLAPNIYQADLEIHTSIPYTPLITIPITLGVPWVYLPIIIK